ncbi:MAG: hypothetical protein KKA73_28380 [Chloroflexi bacterium]|nr:hypothetical protein [Chloroflexota bacterium]MBU1751612.1 hypothetical protein [Chloroflexota bacterium]
MSNLSQRIRGLGTTKGLLLVVTGWEALIIALLSIFSGPMANLGVPAFLGLSLDDAERVGRIIMLYHALAIPLVAALVYFILDLLPVEDRFTRLVRPTITVGYMLTSVGAIGFGYFGRNWLLHGLFIAGLSLVFFSGVVLCVGLWPGRRHFALDRLAFWLVALYTLVSAAIGGAAGAYFGNGFTAFLAEDVVRQTHDLGQLAIIAHLHIMLTLIDVVLLLIVARTLGLRQGRLYQAALLLTIGGTTIVSVATWSVMVWEKVAHKIINVGAAFLLPGALIVAGYGLVRLAQGPADPGRARRVVAVLRDPIRLGILFELVFVNLVVTIPGVYVAFNLETYRQPDMLQVERTILVGHWHVLATVSAVIALFLVMDRLGVTGWLRQIVGWGVLLGSTLALVVVQFYMFQGPGSGLFMLAIDGGVGLTLVALAGFLIIQLLRVAVSAPDYEP